MTLAEMRNVDPGKVDRGTLVQRSEVRVPKKGGKYERISEYMRQVGNPYCYLDGDVVVKVSFAGSDNSIEDCLRSYLAGV